jgi:hypothetical protein
MKLTTAQLAKAQRIARHDYEVRNLLCGYQRDELDDDGFGLLLEEIGETAGEAVRQV